MCWYLTAHGNTPHFAVNTPLRSWAAGLAAPAPSSSVSPELPRASADLRGNGGRQAVVAGVACLLKFSCLQREDRAGGSQPGRFETKFVLEHLRAWAGATGGHASPGLQGWGRLCPGAAEPLQEPCGAQGPRERSGVGAAAASREGAGAALPPPEAPLAAAGAGKGPARGAQELPRRMLGPAPRAWGCRREGRVG